MKKTSKIAYRRAGACSRRKLWKNKTWFKDLLLFVLLISAAFVLFLAQRGGGEGKTVEVWQNGKLYGTYAISTDRVIEINPHIGLEIKDGSVFFADSDCPRRDCLRAGAANKAGQCIICLPNRITVKVRGAGELDGVTG